MSSARSVLLCGAWDEGAGYPRTAGLCSGLERAGHVVSECRVPGFSGSKKELLRKPWRWLPEWLRSRREQRRLQGLLTAAIERERPNCIVVPYPGHHLVAGIKARTDLPVVLDLFLSAYDTVVEDRELCEPGSIGAWAMQQLDTRACKAADLVLVDTPENAAYTAALTGLPPERFAWLPLTDPDANAGSLPLPSPADELRLLFFGTGVPLHGLATLIDAVARVPSVHLTLVGGTRQDRADASHRLGDRLSLQPEFVDRARLRELMAGCDLVAGVFGSSGKTQRVVPWKLVIALAAGRPVITADTPAVCGWLEGSDSVFFAPAGDAPALADRLRDLAEDRSAVLQGATSARSTYDRHFGSERAAGRWDQLLDQLAADQAAEVTA